MKLNINPENSKWAVSSPSLVSTELALKKRWMLSRMKINMVNGRNLEFSIQEWNSTMSVVMDLIVYTVTFEEYSLRCNKFNDFFYSLIQFIFNVKSLPFLKIRVQKLAHDFSSMCFNTIINWENEKIERQDCHQSNSERVKVVQKISPYSSLYIYIYILYPWVSGSVYAHLD